MKRRPAFVNFIYNSKLNETQFLLNTASQDSQLKSSKCSVLFLFLHFPYFLNEMTLLLPVGFDFTEKVPLQFLEILCK